MITPLDALVGGSTRFLERDVIEAVAPIGKRPALADKPGIEIKVAQIADRDDTLVPIIVAPLASDWCRAVPFGRR